MVFKAITKWRWQWFSRRLQNGDGDGFGGNDKGDGDGLILNATQRSCKNLRRSSGDQTSASPKSFVASSSVTGASERDLNRSTRSDDISNLFSNSIAQKKEEQRLVWIQREQENLHRHNGFEQSD